MHYVLFYQLVDGFTEKRTPYRAQHLAKVAAARDCGELVMAGALADPTDSAMLVFREGPEAAEEFARTDPYVTSGLVTSWHVRKWMTVVGAGAVMPVLTQ